MIPSFRSTDFLLAHVDQTMRFYHPRCIDPAGGFRDDGRVYDAETRHLVSSARFVFNYAMAYRHFDRPAYLDAVRHGLGFLREVHRDPATGGYTWLLKWSGGRKQVLDGDNHCYGLAFVLLAYAHALAAGIEEARGHVAETFELMERRFWQPASGLYADQATSDWQTLLSYRGQNANMHACEALIAAYEATGELRYLHRAELIAHHITVRQAGLAGGRIWEHYTEDWQVDWAYNLDRHAAHLAQPADWLLPRAVALFDDAMAQAWDPAYGGIAYGFDPQGVVCDGDKYFWVQAESLAAAALLAARTGDAGYWDWYDRIWAYSWAHLVDHEHGAWFRILSGKTDYHTMGACYEVLGVLGAGA